MLVQQFGQVIFMNRNSALLQRSHFGFIVIDTDDTVSDFCKACRGDKTHITRTDNRNGHGLMLILHGRSLY